MAGREDLAGAALPGARKRWSSMRQLPLSGPEVATTRHEPSVRWCETPARSSKTRGRRVRTTLPGDDLRP